MIVFRVDSSTLIGSGHLMRCLTLAKQLKKTKQAEIAFISRDLAGNLNHFIESNGYRLLLLPRAASVEELTGYEQWLTVRQDVDAGQTKQFLQGLVVEYLIIDSYGFDKTWEDIVRPYVNKIMVIDDLANRKHNCDILLDQNYYCEPEHRYAGLVPSHCKLLLGPQYALLREEFYEARKKMRIRDGTVKNILIFFGGSDLTNETMKALQALEALQRTDIQVNVIVGASNNNKENIEAYCLQHDHIHYFCQVNNMAELMNEADFAIGAGGTATWERCFLSLPAIVITIAENQVEIAENCKRIGVIEYLGQHEMVTCKMIENVSKLFIQDCARVKNIEKNMEALLMNEKPANIFVF
ncbi:UDP-2,4-diacetamido-2,4,6-trideoxy-beta-L-altropyranose hydrolase [Sporomusa sphaeroides]|uniref:UDP-2,4-diacetamido-2,4, 6-trideoxy-beta-L-altropyranose hydrolase n=1 Tax=Sporomusa sphaeroides TaxID=47679 RepID=UPI0031588728